MRKRSRILRLFLGFGVLCLVPANPGSSQSPDLEALQREIEALKAGQAAIQKELQELRKLVIGRQAGRPTEPQASVLSVAGAPFIGDEKAALTLIEFSDYQCPFCARHARETLPQIEQEYISTGKVKYIFRDFPIESSHSQAFKGHEAARCAGGQGKLWEMHARLFSHQRTMNPDNLSNHAQALGLDATTFQACLDSSKHAPGIRTSLADGQKAGVTGTPTFFLGYTEPSDQNITIVRMLRGAQSYTNFKEAIDSLLTSRQQ